MADQLYRVAGEAQPTAPRRISRRRALGASLAGVGGLSAFLAACGGSSNNGGGSSSGLSIATATPGAAATSAAGQDAAVKKGGTLQPGLRFYTNPIPTLDPQATNTVNTLQRSNGVYGYLVQTKAGKIETGVLEGDLATSWESPDQQTWTVKLNTRAMFHPPLNRPLSSEDVVFSYNRITGKSNGRPGPAAGQFSNVDSLTAPDGATVVYKLKSPDPYFPINVLANNIGGQIVPKETETAFDPAQKMVGTGPYLFESYQVGSKLTFNRNPNWFKGPDLPYFDTVICNIIEDPTAKLNYFLGGQLDYLDARGVDLAPIAASVKGAQANLFSASVDGWSIMFQYKDMPSNTPWLDVRVRQALSMALDRDSLFEAATQASLVKKAGFPLDVIWRGPLAANQANLNIDPRKDLDEETAAYFQFNPQKAKALLAQAGYPDGFDLQLERNQGVYGEAYDNPAEAIPAMLNAIGVRVRTVVRDQNSWFAPKNQLGVFDQAQIYLAGGISNSPVSNVINVVDSDSRGNLSHFNDPEITSTAQGMVGKDDATVTATIKQIQIALAKKMYWIPAFTRLNYWVYQPTLRNVTDYYAPGGVYNDFNKNVVQYWRDS